MFGYIDETFTVINGFVQPDIINLRIPVSLVAV